MYSIILVYQGRESMNGQMSGAILLAVPATYVVSVCIIVSCCKLSILADCAERTW